MFFPNSQRNLRRDKDRRNMLQFNLQTLPKSAKQKERWGSQPARTRHSSRTKRSELIRPKRKTVVFPAIANKNPFLTQAKPLLPPDIIPRASFSSRHVAQQEAVDSGRTRQRKPRRRDSGAYLGSALPEHSSRAPFALGPMSPPGAAPCNGLAQAGATGGQSLDGVK